MNECDEFAIKFGKWLNDRCDPTEKIDVWLLYSKDGTKTQKKITKELLKIYKDEKEN